MQLCDKDIHSAIVNGYLGFVGTNERYPFDPTKQVQPSSIDLRLGDIIVRYKSEIKEFDIKNSIIPEQHLDIKKYGEGEPIKIEPGEIIYGQIYEQMWIGDKYSARVEGRSRVARLGLSIHCTGSYINPGFCGAMPLQIINYNNFPIVIYPYIGICQLVIFEISDEPLVKYSDRSRIFNPYFDEKIASPSVLKLESTDESSKSIVEQRMTQLVTDFYNGLKGKKLSSFKNMEEEQIKAVVVQNIQNSTHNGDQYFANIVGTQGANSGVNSNITISQNINSIEDIDFSKLSEELEVIKRHLKSCESNDDTDILIGDVSHASKAIKENKKHDVINFLKKAGKKLFEIAKSLGCSIIANIIVSKI